MIAPSESTAKSVQAKQRAVIILRTVAVAGSRVAASRADVLLVVVRSAAAAHAERVRLVAALTERAGTLADLTLQFAERGAP